MKLKKIILIVLVICMTGVFNSSAYALNPDSTGTEEKSNIPDETQPAATTSTVNDDQAIEAKEKEIAAKQALEKARQEAEAKLFYTDIEAIVKKHLDDFYKKGGEGVIGIYIKELNTGYEYDYNGSKLAENPPTMGEGYFMTASTVKLMAASIVYYLNYNGKLEIDNQYIDNITKSKYNMKQLTYRMITHSVNGYFNTLLRYFGSQEMNKILVELGTKNTFIYSEIGPAPSMSVSNNIKRYGISRSPRTTPKDLGYILNLLYDGTTFGAVNSKLFDDSLRNNIYTNRLPQGINYKSPVAHKTGTAAGSGVYNDAGIIYLDGNPYIMVVMSRNSQSSVQTAYRAMAKGIYSYMSSRIPIASTTPEEQNQ